MLALRGGLLLEGRDEVGPLVCSGHVAVYAEDVDGVAVEDFVNDVEFVVLFEVASY